MKENGYEVFVMTDNTHQTDRLQAIIEDKNQAAPLFPYRKRCMRDLLMMNCIYVATLTIRYLTVSKV